MARKIRLLTSAGVMHIAPRNVAKVMPVKIVLVIALLCLIARPAAAADQAANFLVSLYMNVCIPNLGQPAKVRDWAGAHHLGQIHDAAPLGLFVGDGNKGAAWAIPMPIGSFALSIRGITQACAVWARAADPDEVELLFKKLIAGVARPGLVIAIDKDTVEQTPVGKARALVYNVTVPNAPTSYEFTMLTAEKTGGAFQASLQAAQASRH